MRTKHLAVLAVSCITAFAALGQSAIDVYNITPTQLRGTARFVSMGGAFTSLGGDISTLGQNPAGLAMYRRSEIGLTFDVSIRNYNTASGVSSALDETKCYFDNFGYIGTINLSGPMRTFNWGVSYNRNASFDRMTSGYTRPTQTSLSNYIASFTQGVSSDNLLDTSSFNPYASTSEDWLSILAYNSYMINNVGNDQTYAGLYQNGTEGDAEYYVRENGYWDEYNIDFGGNVSDIVYWGLGVGITELQYSRETNYSESMANASVYDSAKDAIANGNAGFNLYNNKYVSGTGANLKFGIIVRPIDQIRVGLAVHTPTWLHLEHNGYGDVDRYNYTPDGSTRTLSGSASTDDYTYRSRLNSPWRFMAGVSGVIAGRAILSFDYERVAYGDMSVKSENYDRFGGAFVKNEYTNADIKDYFKAADIFRIGAEFRLTNQFSLRAGYSNQKTNVREAASSGAIEVYTNGTDPSYIFNKSEDNICFGAGYRYKAWYIDLAYQHTRQKSVYHAYTDFAGVKAPTAELTAKYNNIILSTGFRF